VFVTASLSGDGNPVNNTVTLTQQVTARQFDLRLFAELVAEGAPTPGESLLYRYALFATTGPEFFLETTLTTTVPVGTTFIPFDLALPFEGQSDLDWVCAGDGGPGSTCTLLLGLDPTVSVDIFGDGSRVPGGVSVNFVVRIDADHPREVPISNTASVPTEGDFASGDDLNPDDNTSTVETALAAPTPPLPPFFPPFFPPSVFSGTGARFDGAPAPNGALVIATNQDGNPVGSTQIQGGEWTMTITPAMAETVQFRIAHSRKTASFPVVAGVPTNVPLDLNPETRRPVVTWKEGVPTITWEEPTPPPTIEVVTPPSCAGGVAANATCTLPDGTQVTAPGLPPPSIFPKATGPGAQVKVLVVIRIGPPPNGLGSGLGTAQTGSQTLDSPVRITSEPGPPGSDPAGLQYFQVTPEGLVPVPTEVDYEAGTVSATVDQLGEYILVTALVRDIPLPAGIAALGFHGAPGTPPALIQGQLDHPDALQAMFQFKNGAWETFRPGGLALLNSLTRIDAHAPLFLSLSRATRWAGPVLYLGDHDVVVASGFTAVTYTGLNPITPEALVAQFRNAGAVTVIFAWDNALNAGGGGYRTFRAAGPSFLNDLETIKPYDVFFVLTERATSLSLPEFVLPE